LIDLHCHILPELDDGSFSVEESLAMARQAVSDGIKTLVATPHTLNGVYSNPAQMVNDQVARLREVFLMEKLGLDLLTGSEAHISIQMAERVASGEIVTINNNGRYVLVEFPVQAIPIGSQDELFQLKLEGTTPIIAHPERNIMLQHRLEFLYDLVAMGCLLQITAMSITGELGKDAMKCSHRLLDLRLAHVIATDAHSSMGRPPILSPGVEAAANVLGNFKEAEAMVTTYPEDILAGNPLDVPEPKRPSKRKWFFRKK
jgi:protein-tyrosine phosphatase